MILRRFQGFPGDSVVKNPPASAGGTGLMPDMGGPHVLRSNETHAPHLLKPVCPRAVF